MFCFIASQPLISQLPRGPEFTDTQSGRRNVFPKLAAGVRAGASNGPLLDMFAVASRRAHTRLPSLGLFFRSGGLKPRRSPVPSVPMALGYCEPWKPHPLSPLFEGREQTASASVRLARRVSERQKSPRPSGRRQMLLRDCALALWCLKVM